MLYDLLSRVAEVGRSLSLASRERAVAKPASLSELCETLLSRQGEATGLALSRELLDRFAQLGDEDKLAFFHDLNTRFGVDHDALNRAMLAWQAEPSDATARALHFASEPRTQELIRRLNRTPGGILDLVRLREDLLKAARVDPSLKPLDRDFQHLFISWFNRGFLELRRIDWSTSAEVLEKFILYEAVHQINGWEDLRLRVAAKDRCLFAFFHPALTNEPLIFVEIALTAGIPNAIMPILSEQRDELDPLEADTAVFYSISNCQVGLRGVSFGNFLIKQVVEDLREEFAGLKQFVTLSPVPELRNWLTRLAQSGEQEVLPDAIRGPAIELLHQSDIEGSTELIGSLAAHYLVNGKTSESLPVDPVARFHLGNGARLEQINVGADSSARGHHNAWGTMVNYLYDLNDIERNHEAFANEGRVICSAAVGQLLANR